MEETNSVSSKFLLCSDFCCLCLQGIDLKLKQVCAGGVYGWNNIFETVMGEWLEDIANNQVVFS